MTEIKTNHIKKSQFELPSFVSVDEVYVTYKFDGTIQKNVPAAYMKDERYLSTLTGVNTVKQPSFKDKQIYYSLLDGKLTLLPEATITNYYTKVDAVIIEDFDAFTKDTDIVITREYKDLLITLAAIEAMTDIGRGDKVNLMKAEVNDNFRLLGAYAADRKNKEGTQE